MSETNGNGRNPTNGRVLPGNRLSVGNKGANPTARRMNELRHVLTEAATEDDIRDIYWSLLAAAKGGDVAAARLLLDHLVGKPRESIEVSAGDGQVVGLASIAAVIMEAIGDDERARVRVAAAFAELGRPGDGMGVGSGLGA
jgi:hypothetical protein